MKTLWRESTTARLTPGGYNFPPCCPSLTSGSFLIQCHACPFCNLHLSCASLSFPWSLRGQLSKSVSAEVWGRVGSSPACTERFSSGTSHPPSITFPQISTQCDVLRKTGQEPTPIEMSSQSHLEHPQPEHNIVLTAAGRASTGFPQKAPEHMPTSLQGLGKKPGRHKTLVHGAFVLSANQRTEP